MPGETIVQLYVQTITIAGSTLTQAVVQTMLSTVVVGNEQTETETITTYLPSTVYVPGPNQPPETSTVIGELTTETVIATTMSTQTVGDALIKTIAA